MVRIPLAVVSLFALIACQGDPQTSYCESLCDWATSCSTDERGAYPEYDEGGVGARCLTAAETSDSDCANAAEGLNAADAKLLTECTDAVDAAAAECGPMSGSIDELKQGTTPAECVSQGTNAQATFEAARDAAAETNDEMCGRFAYTFCDTVQTCVLDTIGVGDVSEIPEDLVTAAGGTPYDLCRTELNTETSSCVNDGNYALEADITDANIMRQGARECLTGWASVTCDGIGNGSLPKACGLAVSDPSVLVSAFTGVVTAYTSDE